MTKQEKEYLLSLIKNNEKVIQEVEEGVLFETVLTTREMRRSFAQGLTYANEDLKTFLKRIIR